MGRLKPEVSSSQLQAVLDVALKSAVGTSITNPAGLIADGHDGPVWNRVDLRNKLRLLLVVVGVVVLAACVNIAGLLMARGAARQREMLVRKALGAGRWRLFRQLLTESALISLLGGGLGILFALWGRLAVSRFLNGTPEGVQFGTPLDLKVLGFALAITLLTMLLSGIFPALMATRIDPKYGLRNRSAAGAPRLRAGKILVAAQIALSLLLVTGAGLYTRTLINLDRIDLGYAVDHLLFLNLDPGLSGYKSPRTITYYENVQRSLSVIPGVQSAALVSYPLLSGVNWQFAFTIPELPVDRKDTSAQQLIVSENFFSTIGIPILNGREFRVSDRDGTPKVIVINEAFVRKFFSGRFSVGRTIKSGDDVWQIVGVCRDANFIDIKKAIEPTIYFPFRQSSNGSSSFALRTAGSPLSVAEEARKVAAAIDPEVPVTDLRSQVQLRDQNIATERACARYYGSLAVFVLLLSCMGLYGLMAFDVARRTDELGIRLALGATPLQIVGPILRMALLLAFAGFVAGLPLTLVLTRFIRSGLYGVTTTDPLTFLGSVMLLVVVMLIAAWIPARRATRVDPMVALRCE
jgi:predicted permease